MDRPHAHPDGRWRANERRIRLWQHQASAAQWWLSGKGGQGLAEATTKKVDNKNLQKPPRKIPSRSGKHSTLVGVYQRPFCWHGASPSDKKMPWVQKVAILDTRQKVGLKHQQRIEGSPGSVSIRINIWTLTELCNCQILIYLEIKAREWSLESTRFDFESDDKAGVWISSGVWCAIDILCYVLSCEVP